MSEYTQYRFVNEPNKSTTRKPNYFARHWRGELSLSVSYWTNYWLLGWVLFLAQKAIPTEPFKGIDPAVGPTVAFNMLRFLFLIQIWQFVGVWRAATVYQNEKDVWGSVAKAVIVADALANLVTWIYAK